VSIVATATNLYYLATSKHGPGTSRTWKLLSTGVSACDVMGASLW
jgi:hypothetical protein